MGAPNRYSTLVAWAKFILPMSALALLSTLFVFSHRPNPEDALAGLDVNVEQLAHEQRLSRPRYAGTLADGRAITLSAEQAVQQGARPNVIQLSKVEADVALNDNDTAQVSADVGDFTVSDQMVELTGAVRILTTTGYQLVSDAINMALDAMHLVSPGAVVLTGTGVTLEAGAMELTQSDGQALVQFTGGVRLLYQPGE